VRLDVFLAPSELTPAALDGRTVAVIDVLRATTTIAAALHAGARTVIPFLELEDAVRTARQYERGEVKLAGERHMLPIPGFDLGNSPLEFTDAAVGQQTVLLTTTNGTRALHAAEDAKTVLVASYTNFSATLARLRLALESGQSVSIICAASEGTVSLEDTACAGRFVRALRGTAPEATRNDAAEISVLLAAKYDDDLATLFLDAEHGRALRDAGFDSDLNACASLDLYPVLAEYRDRAVVRVAAATMAEHGA
jgi:2-phosphosulfolactate phosphatase